MKRVKPRYVITKRSVVSAFDSVVLPPKVKPYIVPPDFGDDYILGIWPDPLRHENAACAESPSPIPRKKPRTEVTSATDLADQNETNSEPLNKPKIMQTDTPQDTAEVESESTNLMNKSEASNENSPVYNKRILCLDPSAADTTGFCLIDLAWDEAGVVLKEDFTWGSWSLSGLNFLMRCVDLKDYIISDIGEFDELVVEWPMYYDSQKGAVAARQGYTINLAGIAMFIVGWFRIPHQQVFLYTAPDWKGTVPKQVTARRFFKMFDVNVMTVDEHAIDATMMGVYHMKKTLNPTNQ